MASVPDLDLAICPTCNLDISNPVKYNKYNKTAHMKATSSDRFRQNKCICHRMASRRVQYTLALINGSNFFQMTSNQIHIKYTLCTNVVCLFCPPHILFGSKFSRQILNEMYLWLSHSKAYVG